MPDRPFIMSFHDSNHPGPSDPTHPMHMTYASTFGISLLVAYGIATFAFLIWRILSVLPDVFVAQEAAAIAADALATQVADHVETALSEREDAVRLDDLETQVTTAVTAALAQQPARVEKRLLTLVDADSPRRVASGKVAQLKLAARAVAEGRPSPSTARCRTGWRSPAI